MYGWQDTIHRTRRTLKKRHGVSFLVDVLISFVYLAALHATR